MSDGVLLVISGPSGSGKGTVVKQLAAKEDYALSISVTTRAPRTGEEHGREYFFITKAEYMDMVKNEELLENAEFCGNFYGTPKTYAEEQISIGKNVILEIEVKGALQIKEKFNDCVLIFLMPPDMRELKRRLLNRGTEDSEEVEKRLRRADEEIELIGKYDYLVLNDSIEDALQRIETIIKAEKMRPKRSGKTIKSFKGD